VPDASFFLSREWVDCWLATFGEDLNPELLAFVADGDVVAAVSGLAHSVGARYPLRRVYAELRRLKTKLKLTCIEYNSLLSLPDYAELDCKGVGELPAEPILG